MEFNLYGIRGENHLLVISQMLSVLISQKRACDSEVGIYIGGLKEGCLFHRAMRTGPLLRSYLEEVQLSGMLCTQKAIWVEQNLVQY